MAYLMKQTKRIGCFMLAIIMVTVILPYTEKQADATNTKAKVSLGVTVDSSATVENPINVGMDITGTAGIATIVPTDIVLILDVSGSMNGTKITNMKDSANKFIDNVDLSTHRISIVPFDSSVRSCVDFTTDANVLKNTVSSLYASGGTEVYNAIDKAVEELDTNSRSGCKPIIILLTDGVDSNETSAAASAQIAKDKGFVFYTVALLDNGANPDTSHYNQFLKTLSTTDSHHNYVGADKLDEVYQDIASGIGVENPYNVSVTATLSKNFDLIEGSTENNVPEPVISGKTVTWNMLEILDSAFTWDFQVKARSDLNPGSYYIFDSVIISYEHYDGTKEKTVVKGPKINIEETEVEEPDEYVFSLVKNTSTENIKESIKVNVNKTMDYKSDFTVNLGSTKLDVTKKAENYFYVNIPSSVAMGEYPFTVINDGITYDLGTFSVLEDKRIGDYNFSRSSSEEGVADAVKATCSYSVEYGADFKVEMGGEELSLYNVKPAFFYFNVPTTLSPGTYEIVMKNQGKKKTIGTYTITEKPVVIKTIPDYTLNSYTSQEGQAVNVKASSNEKMTYKDDFDVKIGDTSVKVFNTHAMYFYFKLPNTLTPGTYDVTMTNDGISKVIASYEVTKKPATEIANYTLNITSSQEQVATNVKATADKNAKYEDDFEVQIGGVTVKTYNTKPKYFYFRVPTTMTPGTYDVTMVNGGTTKVIGQYTITAKPPYELPNYKLNSSSCLEKTSTNVKASADKSIKYEDDFEVKVGSEVVNAYNKHGLFFYFTVPSTLAVGTYDVSVTNNGTTKVIGTYEIKQKPPYEIPEYLFSSNSSKAGASAKIKARTNVSVTYGSDFNVEIGGVSITAYNKHPQYFYFNVPSSLTPGTYNITMTDNGTTKVIGTYTIN